MNTMISPSSRRQNHGDLKARRRQVRRGTHSCWECKRRKMKCIFEATTNVTACYGCRRRGSSCISQEFPEDSAMDVEMVAKLNGAGRAETMSTVSSVTTSPFDNRLTPSSMTMEPPQQPAAHKYESVSRLLYTSLPSREDTERICNAIPQRPAFAHEIMTMPYTCLSQNERTGSEDSLEIPGPNMHPVLIARHMLLLASLLQHLRPDVHAEIKYLSETPRAMSEQLADLAISCVTTKDELLGSIEGLDCITIESVYQANLGNLRRSWIAGRRAVSVAQLMGLNRPNNRAQYDVLDPRTKYDPRIMWSRIVFLDRFLCLLLGLPQGCTERGMGSEVMLTSDLPMERLERIHCTVASRILERNEFESSDHDLAITRTLDLELQKAARSVPGKWWLTPKLESAGADSQALFWNTGRLFAQVLHYNLLNQLHLPYMLHSLRAGQQYEYSRITCVNASREVLSRFVALRNFNGIASSCRIIDFIALMAAMTLLLAHLDSQSSARENLLAHQYHIDRAMIEQVQENFRGVNNLNSDALSAHSADLLRRLLAIETDIAHGSPQCAGRVSVHKAGSEKAQENLKDKGAVDVHIPYFGIIRIAYESLNPIRSESSTMGSASHSAQPQAVDTFDEGSTQSSHENSMMPPGPSNAQSMGSVDTNSCHIEAPVMKPRVHTTTQAQPDALSTPTSGVDYSNIQFASQHMDELDDPLLRQGEYPGLAAGTDDWAFQGVDLAFFDSLMRSTGSGEAGIED